MLQRQVDTSHEQQNSVPRYGQKAAAESMPYARRGYAAMPLAVASTSRRRRVRRAVQEETEASEVRRAVAAPQHQVGQR